MVSLFLLYGRFSAFRLQSTRTNVINVQHDIHIASPCRALWNLAQYGIRGTSYTLQRDGQRAHTRETAGSGERVGRGGARDRRQTQSRRREPEREPRRSRRGELKSRVYYVVCIGARGVRRVRRESREARPRGTGRASARPTTVRTTYWSGRGPDRSLALLIVGSYELVALWDRPARAAATGESRRPT